MPEFGNEYPGNSHKNREPDPVEPKHIERVTEGKVVRRKTPLGKRFTSLFLAGESDGSVMNYVFMEVLLPGARDMVADAITQYVERRIFGGARSTMRRPGPRTNVGSTPGYVSYNRYSKPSNENPRQGISAQAKATHNFDELILENRIEAMEVLEKLGIIIEKYEQASVSDLFELVGETGSFTDQRWGWDNIRDADIQRVREGYLLRLPMPIELKV